jgi:uncharacterized membrane protein (DUF485 family)
LALVVLVQQPMPVQELMVLIQCFLPLHLRVVVAVVLAHLQMVLQVVLAAAQEMLAQPLAARELQIKDTLAVTTQPMTAVLAVVVVAREVWAKTEIQKLLIVATEARVLLQAFQDHQLQTLVAAALAATQHRPLGKMAAVMAHI